MCRYNSETCKCELFHITGCKHTENAKELMRKFHNAKPFFSNNLESNELKNLWPMMNQLKDAGCKYYHQWVGKTTHPLFPLCIFCIKRCAAQSTRPPLMDHSYAAYTQVHQQIRGYSVYTFVSFRSISKSSNPKTDFILRRY